MAVPPIHRGNLVRWRNGQAGNIGVVIEALQDGRQARVHFDSGETLVFAWPSSALERVVFHAGSQVESSADRQVGVVTALSVNAGRRDLPGRPRGWRAQGRRRDRAPAGPRDGPRLAAAER